MTNAVSLRPGDRLPDFSLPELDGKLRKFIWSFTGEPVALIVVDDLKNVDAEQLQGLIAACRSASAVPVVVCAPTPSPPPARSGASLRALATALSC